MRKEGLSPTRLKDDLHYAHHHHLDFQDGKSHSPGKRPRPPGAAPAKKKWTAEELQALSRKRAGVLCEALAVRKENKEERLRLEEARVAEERAKRQAEREERRREREEKRRKRIERELREDGDTVHGSDDDSDDMSSSLGSSSLSPTSPQRTRGKEYITARPLAQPSSSLSSSTAMGSSMPSPWLMHTGHWIQTEMVAGIKCRRTGLWTCCGDRQHFTTHCPSFAARTQRSAVMEQQRSLDRLREERAVEARELRKALRQRYKREKSRKQALHPHPSHGDEDGGDSDADVEDGGEEARKQALHFYQKKGWEARQKLLRERSEIEAAQERSEEELRRRQSAGLPDRVREEGEEDGKEAHGPANSSAGGRAPPIAPSSLALPVVQKQHVRTIFKMLESTQGNVFLLEDCLSGVLKVVEASEQECERSAHYGGLWITAKALRDGVEAPPVQHLGLRLLVCFAQGAKTRQLVKGSVDLAALCGELLPLHKKAPPHASLEAQHVLEVLEVVLEGAGEGLTPPAGDGLDAMGNSTNSSLDQCLRTANSLDVSLQTVSTFRRHAHNPALVSSAFRVLELLGRTKEGMETILKQSVISQALKMMQRYEANSAVLVTSLRVLLLGCSSAKGRHQVQKLDGIVTVLHTMKRLLGETELQVQGAQMMWTLVREEPRAAEQLQNVTGGWQWLCQGIGSTPGEWGTMQDVLLKYQLGKYHAAGWSVGDEHRRQDQDDDSKKGKGKGKRSNMGGREDPADAAAESLYVPPPNTWTEKSMLAFLGDNAQLVAQFKHIPDYVPSLLEVLRQMDALPQSGEETDAWMERLYQHQLATGVDLNVVTERRIKWRHRQRLADMRRKQAIW